MTAALALAAPSRFAPFLATHATVERAWMLRPATVTVGRLAWTVATDGASLYAEPWKKVGAARLCSTLPVEYPLELERLLQRAERPGVPMRDEDRQLLRRYAAHPDEDGAVRWEGARYDAARLALALDTLVDSPRLHASVHPAPSREWNATEGAHGPLNVREGRELMLWGSGGRVVAVMNCG